MCTCITFQNKSFYFGRNLDLEYSFGERVVITPRKYVFDLRTQEKMIEHYAMIGMATVIANYPLYAEASNEKGLSMAGLYFPDNAEYQPMKEDMINITPFEFIPWILGKCSSVDEAEELLGKVNIVKIQFNENIPLAPLHWMLADEKRCIVLESMKGGLYIHENPIGILTNNPPFDYHKTNLSNYMNVTPHAPVNRFTKHLNLQAYGQGMGGIGLPGDVSPTSRFVRAAFMQQNSVCEEDEVSNVTQFFHMLDSVSMVRGSTITPEGKYDITTYSCCFSVENGIYYYKTYENNQISAVKLFNENLDGSDLFVYDFRNKQQIYYEND